MKIKNDAWVIVELFYQWSIPSDDPSVGTSLVPGEVPFQVLPSSVPGVASSFDPSASPRSRIQSKWWSEFRSEWWSEWWFDDSSLSSEEQDFWRSIQWFGLKWKWKQKQIQSVTYGTYIISCAFFFCWQTEEVDQLLWNDLKWVAERNSKIKGKEIIV